MTTTYKVDDDAVFRALRTLPTKHSVFQNWRRWRLPEHEWWDSVKHNTGPEWDEFRMKIIEAKHLS